MKRKYYLLIGLLIVVVIFMFFFRGTLTNFAVFGDIDENIDLGNIDKEKFKFYKESDIIDESELVDFIEIVSEDGFLIIDYNFDSTNIIGETTSVEIWVIDETDLVIIQTWDVFSILQDGIINRRFKIGEIGDFIGTYKINLAESNELDNSVSRIITFSQTSKVTGFVIFDTNKGKISVYALFIIIISIISYLIWRRHKKSQFDKRVIPDSEKKIEV